MATYDDSYEERQEDEVNFLQAVFPGDFRDLRHADPWKIKRPPEIQLTLVPQKSMGGSAQNQRPLSIKLIAKYPTDYPDSVPELQLEEPQGLTEDHVKDLSKEIEQLAGDRVGEVMMLEIAQHVQAFLHKHDRPPVSLYEEMLQRQRQQQLEEQRRREAEREAWRMREEEEHRQIEEEIQRKKAELRERRGHSDEDSEEDSEPEDSIASPERQAPLPLHPSPLPPSATSQLQPEGVGRRGEGMCVRSGGQRLSREHIHKGKNLGVSSSGGNTVYVGLDSDSGDLLAIYEWVLHCTKKGDNRRLKQVASIQQEFEGYQQRCIRHSNLVQYLSMTHGYHDNKITVEVVMEYVGGGSVSSLLRNPDCGPVKGETLHHYSKQLLEAVSYLHSEGIVHNNIKPSLVFFGSGGSIKLGGFSIIKRLSDLHRAMSTHVKPSVTMPPEDEVGTWPLGVGETRGGKKGDILKLGMLILCLALGKMDVGYPPSFPPNLPDPLADFLNKCLDTNEQRRFPAHDLLHHPFITPSPSPSQPHSTAPTTTTTTTETPLPGLSTFYRKGSMQFQRSDSIVGSPARPYCRGSSRLETEFEGLETLGSGGFGEVIKVRNHLDGRLYALKKIPIRSGSKVMMRITREVELLSQMNHENVVRYYSAWIETYSAEEFQRHSGTNPSEGSEELSSGSEDETMGENDPSDVAANAISTSSESSESESDYSLVSSESFHSAGEDFGAGNDSDSFIMFEASSSTLGPGRREEEKEEEEEGVFMNEFSSSPAEQRNFIGELESQVMDISAPRLRVLTAESSDTVVFMDSSVATSTSRPIPIAGGRGEGRRERRRGRTQGEVHYLYIQMEYCENQTLRQLIDTEELWRSEDRVWRLFREIVEGLEHIHSKGMIHRDLKPGNIFLNSSGHIKIGDFGLASYKHSMSKQSSILVHNSSLAEYVQEGETGLVGTAAYLAPESLKEPVKYSQKVDIYSLGLIFFEMCQPPAGTVMERQKLLSDIKKREIVFPASFDVEKRQKQAELIRWLLNHNPHERPTSKQLLQSPLLPLKMEDEELQEVLLRTLQSTNSTRYRLLIDKLFSQEGSRVSEFSYFVDPQEAKRTSQKKSKFWFCYTLLQQMVHSKLIAIFSRHGASYLRPPLLAPRSTLYGSLESQTQFMDRSGAIISLPCDHRVPFARYVSHQDISYLKRYMIAPVYREGKVQGSHPREAYECVFDIVSPNPGSLVPDAEAMFVVSEIISELPGFQDSQYSVWVNHSSLLSSMLLHCSIPTEKHTEVCTILHKVATGAVKSSEVEERLKERNLQLTHLAVKALVKFISSEVPLEEARVLLEPLLKDKSSIGSLSTQAWQEINTVVTHFRVFGAKEPVCLHLSLTHSLQHFSGVIFQFVDSASTQSSTRRQRHARRVPLAIGGRYDKLLSEFRRPGKQPLHPSVCVVGVSVLEEVVMSAVVSAYQAQQGQGSAPSLSPKIPIAKCSVLVCWLGHESLQKECMGLVRDLWSQGIAADLVYESLELDSIDDIQDFCRKNFIPHIVILSDRTLFYERKQVKVRTLESGKVTEKLLTKAELVEFLQAKQGVERSDSLEASTGPVRSAGSSSVESQSNAIPAVNVNIVPSLGKLQGYVKRRYHEQALTKLIPLLQKFSSKTALEILVIDLKGDVLCSLAAEVNKFLASNESRGDLSSVVKLLTESHSASSKKYIAKVCEHIQELLNKKVPVIFLYSHSAEYCQTILNSLESL